MVGPATLVLDPTALQADEMQLIPESSTGPNGRFGVGADSIRQAEPPTQSATSVELVLAAPWEPTAVQPVPLEQVTPESVLGDWAPLRAMAVNCCPFHHWP